MRRKWRNADGEDWLVQYGSLTYVASIDMKNTDVASGMLQKLLDCLDVQIDHHSVIWPGSRSDCAPRPVQLIFRPGKLAVTRRM